MDISLFSNVYWEEMAILAEFVALAPQLVCLKKLKDSKWPYGNSIQNSKNI